METGNPSLADSLQSLKGDSDFRKMSPKCGVGLLLESLSEEDRALLIEVMDIKTIRNIDITKKLVSKGYSIGENAILRHRRRKQAGGCKCPK